MPTTSLKHRLADALLGRPLEDYVRERRIAGDSWRRICLQLRDDIDLDISDETLRAWFLDREWARDNGEAS